MQPFLFAKEDEKTTYLSGKVEALTEQTLDKVCRETFRFAADVFYLGEQNEIPIADALKKRLLHFCDISGDAKTPSHDRMAIEGADFDLESSAYPNLPGAILAVMHENSAEIQKHIFSYTDDLITYFGSRIYVYSVRQVGWQEDIFRLFFMKLSQMVWFVEYQKYAVMLIYGSDI